MMPQDWFWATSAKFLGKYALVILLHFLHSVQSEFAINVRARGGDVAAVDKYPLIAILAWLQDAVLSDAIKGDCLHEVSVTPHCA